MTPTKFIVLFAVIMFGVFLLLAKSGVVDRDRAKSCREKEGTYITFRGGGQWVCLKKDAVIDYGGRQEPKK